MDKWKAVNRNDLTESYEFRAKDAEDARHWVINHLDCSNEWTVFNLEDEEAEIEDNTPKEKLDRLIELVEDRSAIDNMGEAALNGNVENTNERRVMDAEIESLYAALLDLLGE